MRSVLIVSLGLIAVLLTGCTATSTSTMAFASTTPPDRTPYSGRLTTTPSKTAQRPGAAGDVVTCSVAPTGATLRPGSRQPPAGSPETAIDTYVSTELPVRRLARERQDRTRILFTTS